MNTMMTTHYQATPCGCLGPRNGQPLCPCRMKQREAELAAATRKFDRPLQARRLAFARELGLRR